MPAKIAKNLSMLRSVLEYIEKYNPFKSCFVSDICINIDATTAHVIITLPIYLFLDSSDDIDMMQIFNTIYN